ncbi:MAG: hypothetical protein IJE26_03415 [Oscillospiraceae bacterium]|nr:hypothetical protein [Oscillospiraceae bacterium]
MISERENFFKMARGEEREFVPAVMNLFQLVIPTVRADKPYGDVAGVDGFGRRWIKPEGQPVIPDPAQAPLLTEIERWTTDVNWPKLPELDWEAAAKRDVPRRDGERILMVQLTSGPFERLHDLMGFEAALVATVTDPEICEAFFARFCDYRIEQLSYIKEYYNPDLIQFHDDWGSQEDLLISPEFWRTALMPHVKRVVDACHELGMLFNMHTCGRVDRILDDIVGMGVDMIDSMMVCNDLDRWMADYGRKVIFMGGLDSQGVIDRSDATPADLRREVKSRIHRYASKGNYFPMTYCTGPNVPMTLLFAAWYGYTYNGVLRGLPRFLKFLGKLKSIAAEQAK